MNPSKVSRIPIYKVLSQVPNFPPTSVPLKSKLCFMCLLNASPGLHLSSPYLKISPAQKTGHTLRPVLPLPAITAHVVWY